MVVITQRHVHRRDGAQAFEKTKEMRQALRHVEQISRNENPIWVELHHSGDNLVMSRVISIKMQVGEMDSTTTGEKGMSVGEDGDFMIAQTPFPMWNEIERSIERFAQAIADE